MKFFFMFVVALIEFSTVRIVAAEDSLNRLFTTSEQRKQIDEERKNSKTSNKYTDTLRSHESDSVLYLSFDALLKTEIGYSVWINGRLIDAPQKVSGIWLDPKNLVDGKITFSTDKGVVKLKLGQVYWLNNHKVFEQYAKPRL